MNLYYFGTALSLSALYMIAGCGSLFAIKSGEFNMGGEGQIYAGGFICAIFLNFAGKINLPAVFAVFLAIVAAFLISGFLAFLSSILKNYKNASPLFTTFIISASIIPLIDGLIAGPFRTNEGNLLSTAFINQNYRFFSILPPSSCNASLFFAVFLCIALYFFFDRSSFGRKITIFGISPEFSKYSGYNNFLMRNFSLFISGGLHGICGAVAVLGTYFTCHSGFYSGMGWNALSASLIAGLNPVLLIPSSVVLAFIVTYADKFALFNNLGFDISSLIQGIILFMIGFCLKGSVFADFAKEIKTSSLKKRSQEAQK